MIKQIENYWCAKLERTFSQSPKKYQELTDKLAAVDSDLECRQAQRRTTGKIKEFRLSAVYLF